MALNIMKAGHDLVIHNRTGTKEELLMAQGAKRAASPRDAARDAEVIVTCLSDTPDVEEVVLGEKGIIHGARPGAVLVDMSTISPEATRRIAQVLETKAIRMIDAPVSGGSEGAERGTLAIMVGGDPEDVERVLPGPKKHGYFNHPCGRHRCRPTHQSHKSSHYRGCVLQRSRRNGPGAQSRSGHGKGRPSYQRRRSRVLGAYQSIEQHD